MDDLLHFWEPGVFIRHTPHYPRGHLCCAPLTPVVCDLPAARQIMGSASHSSTNFCSLCKLPLQQIDNLDTKSWQLRTLKDHLQSAHAWKNVVSTSEQSKLFHNNGIRWSELLCLPYWDPTAFVVLNCMLLLLLLLGNLQRHCREVWGMNFHLEDDDFCVKPNSKSCTTEEQLHYGNSVLTNGTAREVGALLAKVIIVFFR